MKFTGRTRNVSRGYLVVIGALFVGALLGLAALFTAELRDSMSGLQDSLITLNTYDASDGALERVLSDLFGNAAPEPKDLERLSLASLVDMETLLALKERMIRQERMLVEADLAHMTLSVYRDGAIIQQYPIVSKGREGSWWETPAGIYRVGAKEEKHFSSIGKVYMPWSIQFQGNFFIHGWPYYPDGTPVPPGYSGGCIRLSTEDAKAVYALIDEDTPILVLDADSGNDDFAYAVAPPQVSASAYLVADLKSGFVFAEHHADISAPMASLAKLMTALVSAEHIYLERTIRISQSMLEDDAGYDSGIRIGQRVSAYELLFPLLRESSNDAAGALGAFVGQVRFVELMNEKAAALGMEKTVFADASGLDENNISTAQDLYKLARYLYSNRKFIFDITSGKEAEFFSRAHFLNVKNFNGLAGDKRFIGGKIGETIAAKQTALAVFGLRTPDGEKRPVAIILLASDDQSADMQNILNWLSRVYFPAE